MDINFAAENMAGYNNPEIEIVNIEVSKTAEILTDITYYDIETILARGTFPIVSLWRVEKGFKMRYILPLAYIGVNKILFSVVASAGSVADPTCKYMGIEFTSGGPNLIMINIQKK